MDAMVVETVFPSSSSDNGTVSTRLVTSLFLSNCLIENESL